jgi:hypothetical protein
MNHFEVHMKLNTSGMKIIWARKLNNDMQQPLLVAKKISQSNIHDPHLSSPFHPLSFAAS